MIKHGRDELLRQAQYHADKMREPLEGLGLEGVPFDQVEDHVRALEAPTVARAQEIIELAAQGRRFTAATVTPKVGGWCAGSAGSLNHAIIKAAREAVDWHSPQPPHRLALQVVIYQWGQPVMWCLADVVMTSWDEAFSPGEYLYDLNIIITKPGGVRDMLHLEEVPHTAESIATAVMDFL